MLIREQGLTARIEEIEALPLEDPDDLLSANPLGKVPALIRDGATPLVDSPLICEYIDSLNEDRWIPKSGTSRWRVLRFQAIADGILDLVKNRAVARPAACHRVVTPSGSFRMDMESRQEF